MINIHSNRLNYFLVVLILGVSVFLCYGNALFNHFVWDDGYLIVDNPYVKNLEFVGHLFKGDVSASTTISHKPTAYYRPLSMLSFMVDYHLWRLNPRGFHLTNIAIHLANCLLIFFIALQISQNKTISLWTSLLFAVHPIHVEAVTPIYNRMGIQAAFFMLAGFLFFIKSDYLRKTQLLFGALAMFCLGLLSKENALILPVLFIAFDYFYWSHEEVRNLLQKDKIKFYGACFLIGLCYLFVRRLVIEQQPPFPFFGHGQVQGHVLADNLFLHVLTVIKITGGYIAKVIAPVHLSAVYWVDPVRNILDPGLWASIFFLAVLAVFAFDIKNTSRDERFFLGFFFIGILFASNIIPISAAYVFRERFLYFPSLAFCYIVAKFIYDLVKKFYEQYSIRALLNGGFVILLVWFGIMTVIANYTWRNNLFLWETTVSKVPSSQLAHLNLGQAYLDVGQREKAFDEFEKSMKILPRALDGVYLAKLNLAKIYIEIKQYQKALKETNEAVEIAQALTMNPFALYDKLGLIYVHLNDLKSAEDNFKEALKHKKDFGTARYNLGILYYQKKEYQKAQEQLAQVVRLNPDNIYAIYSLGLTYKAQGKSKEAKDAFRATLRLNALFSQAKEQLDTLE